MLSATLEAGLSDYAIGAKIRSLRLKKKGRATVCLIRSVGD